MTEQNAVFSNVGITDSEVRQCLERTDREIRKGAGLGGEADLQYRKWLNDVGHDNQKALGMIQTGPYVLVHINPPVNTEALRCSQMVENTIRNVFGNLTRREQYEQFWRGFIAMN